MALLNENRNRVPLIVFAPADGDFDSIRGQLRMIGDEDNTVLYLCTHSDTSGEFANVITTIGGNVRYTATVPGTAGNTITVDHVLGAVDTATTTASAVGSPPTGISVELATDSSGATIATSPDVVAAVNALGVLVTASVAGNTTITVAAESKTLSGGLDNGRKATLTAPGAANGAVDYISVGDAVNGLPGPTIEHAETGGALDVTVTGNDFQKNVIVSGTFAAATATEIAAAVNADAEAKLLVVATAEGDGTGINAALSETVLVKPTSNSNWAAVTIV